MCSKYQVKPKKLIEARNLVDEVSRFLSGLKRNADSDSVPLAKRLRPARSGRRQASFFNLKLSDITF